MSNAKNHRTGSFATRGDIFSNLKSGLEGPWKVESFRPEDDRSYMTFTCTKCGHVAKIFVTSKPATDVRFMVQVRTVNADMNQLNLLAHGCGVTVLQKEKASPYVPMGRGKRYGVLK